jgi:hypothetical protein
MGQTIDVERLVPCDRMQGDDTEETELLRTMHAQAMSFLKSFDWCPPIAETYLGFGVGGVLALFLVRFETAVRDADEWLWVVEGDVPSAYFVIDDAPDPPSALAVYCELMGEWVDAVLQGRSLKDVYPVAVEPSRKHAEMLQKRIRFIREKLIPEGRSRQLSMGN